MLFIETPIFTEDLQNFLSDSEYSEFQEHLAYYPLAGTVVQNTGGLRKIRWRSRGKGKRSGVRVIYYYVMADSQIRLLFIYKKGILDNLTNEQKRILRQINERWSL